MGQQMKDIASFLDFDINRHSLMLRLYENEVISIIGSKISLNLKRIYTLNQIYHPWVQLTVEKLFVDEVQFDHIFGTTAGGAFPALEAELILNSSYGRNVSLICHDYILNKQRVDLGDDNPDINARSRMLAFTDVVDSGKTIIDAVLKERKKGRIAKNIACMFFFQRNDVVKELLEEDITLHCPISAEDLMSFGKKYGFVD